MILFRKPFAIQPISLYNASQEESGFGDEIRGILLLGREVLAMWINSDVVIDFPINDKVLQNAIDDCEKYDQQGDYQYFGMASAIDVLCKAFVAGGHMKKREWDMLTARYPE